MFVPAEYYVIIYIGLGTLLTFIAGGKILSLKRNISLAETNISIGILPIILLFLIVFLGFRPIHAVFADTGTYARLYNDPAAFEDDWLFGLFQRVSSKYYDVHVFFFLITVGYIVPMWISCKKLMKNNSDVLIVSCITAMSFYPYGINGIRNGLACSIVLLAIAYLTVEKKGILFFLLLAIIAVGIHKSSILPVVCAVVAFYNRKPNLMFFIWVLSILISLIAGNAIGSFIGTWGFDDRMAYYASHEAMEEYEELFRHTGFRWDFLLYSFIPIVLGWYTIFKRKFIDNNYRILLSTYIYANAFWVLVIYSINSNRFAYLSWFLYPVVLLYPLLRFPVFKKNHKMKTALILFGQLAFTIILLLIR